MRGVGCWVCAVQVHSFTFLVLIFAHYDEWDSSLQWRHNGRDGVSNHQRLDCLLPCLFRHWSKESSKLRVTGFCEGNSPGTGELHAQMASHAENVPFDDVFMSSQYWISILHHIVSSFMFIWNIFRLDYQYVLPRYKRGIRPLLSRWMVISPNKIDRVKRSTGTGNWVNCALLLIPSVFTTSLADQWIKRQLKATKSKGDNLSPNNITSNAYAQMRRSREVPIWHKINLAGWL